MSKIRDQLIRHEGVRLHPYRCTAGKLTIGIGRNLDDSGITLEEAEAMLDYDISICRIECNAIIGGFIGLTEPRKDVLINMLFNLGMGRLVRFVKMLTAVQAGDYDKAAAEMMNSKWAEQVGERAVELSEQMRSGAYQ